MCWKYSSIVSCFLQVICDRLLSTWFNLILSWREWGLVLVRLNDSSMVALINQMSNNCSRSMPITSKIGHNNMKKRKYFWNQTGIKTEVFSASNYSGYVTVPGVIVVSKLHRLDKNYICFCCRRHFLAFFLLFNCCLFGGSDFSAWLCTMEVSPERGEDQHGRLLHSKAGSRERCMAATFSKENSSNVIMQM